MTSRKVLASAAVALSVAFASSGNTVRAPMVTYIKPSTGSNASWFTSTRIWNLGPEVATVSMTDVIGWGSIVPQTFSVPARGLVDLPFFKFGPSRGELESFFALVEFSSDQPIRVDTSVNTYMVAPEQCPSIYPFPGVANPYFAYWGGCVPIAGPLLYGFEDYLRPGARHALSWLMGDPSTFRTTLYLTNPAPVPVKVTAEFRNAGGDRSATIVYTVAAHSLLTIPDFFNSDPRVGGVAGIGYIAPDGGVNSGVTAVFSGDGPYYVFAAAVSNDILGHPSVVNRFNVVQPQSVP